MTFKKEAMVKLTAHTIIIGGGKLGTDLLRDLPKSVLIESSPVKVYWLVREFGEDRIIHGDGGDKKFLISAGIQKAASVIITLSKDRVNRKIAATVKDFHVSKVMVRVEDEDMFRYYKSLGMEPFKVTPAMSAKIIERILKPESIHIHEFILPAKCNAVGMRVDDLDLPNEGKLVSVLRGDHIEIPDPNLVLEEGDVLTVMASEEDVLELRNLLGARLDLNPLQKIIVPYRGKRTVKYALREAFILAKWSNAMVTLIYDKKRAKHKEDVEQLRSMFKLQNVDLGTKGVEGGDDGLRRYLKDMEESYDDEIKRKGVHFDIVMMDPVSSTFFEILSGNTKMKRTIKEIDIPIIVAGNMNPYKNMLMLLESSEHMDAQVSLAIDLAILFGSQVHVLIHSDEDVEDVDRLVKYVTRAGRLYGLDITSQVIEGNPTLEFVEQLKTDKYDLVVVNWKCRTIKQGIVRRIVEYGPRSVLIIP